MQAVFRVEHSYEIAGVSSGARMQEDKEETGHCLTNESY